MESLPLPSSSSATSSSNLMPIFDSIERNWLDLPRDAVLSIFRKLDTIDILIRPHNVCTTWREISKDPSLYRTIDIHDLGPSKYLELLCRRAIDYSCGQIIDINFNYYCTNDLLRLIADKYVPLSSALSYVISQMCVSLIM